MLPEITVYRIENKDHIGPFQALFSWKLISGLNDLWVKHTLQFPGIKDEFPTLSKDYICGCISLDQLAEWFEPFYSELEKYGFFLTEYLTSDYAIGSKQIAFNQETAAITRISMIGGYSNE